MSDLKKSKVKRLSNIEQQKLDKSSETTSPSYLKGFDRNYTFEDQQDKHIQGDKTSRDISFFDKDKDDGFGREHENLMGNKEITILKQLPKAMEMISALPLEYRSKVRQIIKTYEDDRRKYQLQIRRLNKILQTFPKLESKQQKIQQKLIDTHDVIQKDLNNSNIQTIFSPTSLSTHSLAFTDRILDQIPFRMFNTETIKNNHYCQFLTEGFNHTQHQLLQQIQSLKSQLSTKLKLISKHEQKIYDQNKKIYDLESKLDKCLRSINMIDQQKKRLEKMMSNLQSRQMIVSNKQPIITLDLNNVNQLKLPLQESVVLPSRKSSYQSRGRNASASSNQRSPVSKKGSVRNQLDRSNAFFRMKGQQSQNQVSQGDSVQFGKQKVIQKKKLRKIFTNLLGANDQSQRKSFLNKLSLQIGLKSKDMDILFKKD